MFDHICEVVCEGESVKLIDIKRKTRKLEILYPRQLIMYFAKEYKALPTYKSIGEPFGKDHATVIAAHKVIQNYIDTDKTKREQINKYRDKLDGTEVIIKKTEILKDLLTELEGKISLAEQRLVSLQLNVNEIKGLIEKYKL